MAGGRYPDPDSRSAQLHRRAQQVLPGGNSRLTVSMSPYPVYARQGAGFRLVDEDGVERIDFYNNATSLIHGHAHPAIVEAVTAQIARGTAFAHPTEAEIALAELLCARAPGFEQVRFCNSGTEAVMNAIKAARAFTGRPRIAKCEGVYHGSYDPVEVSLDSPPSAWGVPDPLPVAYARGTPPGVLQGVVVLPFNDTERSRALLEAAAGELAAVVIDLLPSRLGMELASPEFLAMLREVTRRHGIVLIVDEVISFRSGPTGLQGVLGVQPDLTALGKIIGGGFPVGAVAGRREIMAMFDAGAGKAPLPHAGTYNGNPVTMVAGRAAMELLTPDAFAALNALGEHTRALLEAVLRETGTPGAAAGVGSLFMLRLGAAPPGYRSQYPTPERQARKLALAQHLLDHGIAMNPSLMGAISTPMTPAQPAALAAAVRSGLAQAAAQALPLP
ncbi:MAG: aminotransferase class III-fold pyridoxal phosphate-dependent enzyme [Candidatus Lambdaproteobacteria bacterium]|nr:aminotransferase class III-fold pyridoxal phosphate-dependent enzyme [Candidatus Lambdaproteobacteria bacterium]